MQDDFVPQWIIERKRDGGALAEAEIREWIARYADGRLPDYQMAALAMAVYWRGMSADETLWLTDAMMRSGDTLSGIARRYGTTVRKLCQLNKIKETKVLQIGQKIRVK